MPGQDILKGPLSSVQTPHSPSGHRMVFNVPVPNLAGWAVLITYTSSKQEQPEHLSAVGAGDHHAPPAGTTAPDSWEASTSVLMDGTALLFSS